MTGIFQMLPEDAARYPYLLIGGHAIVLHGYPRNTLDLDLLVPERSVSNWCQYLKGFGYSVFHQSESFVQFDNDSGLPPVDLMVVDAGTFGKLFAESETREFFGVELRLPSSAHMVALKLHAIRQPARKQVEKDWGDVMGLIQSCGLSLEDGQFRELIQRYGGSEAEPEIRKRLGL